MPGSRDSHQSDPFRDSSPTPSMQQSNQPYQQVPSGSPGLEQDSRRFVSSPLNPRAVAPPSNGQRPRPTSWNSSNDALKPTLEHSGSDRSSGSSMADKDHVMRNVIAGSVGGGYSPYPAITPSRPSSGFRSSRASRANTLNPPVHNRFSTASSVGSVLSFISDSKYATSTSALVRSKFDPDPRASFLPVDQYGVYERIGNGPVDDDDFIHEPGQRNMKVSGISWRGFANVSLLIFLLLALVMLFVGYPVIQYAGRNPFWQNAHVNGTGQIPDLIGLPVLIDPETPADQLTRTGFDGQEYELVFSDEFNTPGRSFYPGDDPFWEAVDLWYYATEDLEWYDPGQITTRDGHLSIVIEQSDGVEHPGLPFKSGMLQSWNKFCFTTGYIEVSVVFPGKETVSGYWPGAWIMGNLGRPGYGSTADGLWPYSYDSCDLGTLANQTLNGSPAAAATAGGNQKYNDNISWLPGQRLSACTCPGEDHPGPSTSNGFKGRSAPEIDIFEAQINKNTYAGGRVTQSVQMAPFTTGYNYPNGTDSITLSPGTTLNPYKGSALQQAVSALTELNGTSFADGGAQYSKFGFEYWSDPDNRGDGFIEWVAGGPTFKVNANVFSGDTNLQISNRLVPEEPMSIVLNLAVSESFQPVILQEMTFPSEFNIDYVRVWQRKGLSNDMRTCNPPNHPTTDYINRHPTAYTNPQWQTWNAATNLTFPKNSMTSTC